MIHLSSSTSMRIYFETYPPHLNILWKFCAEFFTRLHSVGLLYSLQKMKGRKGASQHCHLFPALQHDSVSFAGFKFRVIEQQEVFIDSSFPRLLLR